MRKPISVWLFLLVFLSLILNSVSLLAQQTTGQINGTIFDSQGAALPNAEVSVTESNTGFKRTTNSGDAGIYSLPLLPPGSYKMSVKAKGFSTLEQKDISLSVGQVLTLNHNLKPGAASEVVEVTGEAPMVESSRTEIGGSVSPTEVTSLPILDRNITELMTLIPGVRPAEGFDPTKTRVGNISINGGDGRQLDVNVDGGDNKDLVVGGLVQNFPVEAIQEFNVVTDQYSAEAGHSVGGVANIITKSGTNMIHGSALGLTQLSTLNRTNYFEKQNCLNNVDPITGNPAPINDVSRCKSVFHRYDYAFSLGGPVIKDRLFVFGAFEQKREPGSIVAAPGVLSDLTTFASQTSGFAGGPYAFPAPTLPFPYVDTMAAIRLDYKLSNSQNLFVRYARQRWNNPNDQLGGTNAPFVADSSQSQNDLNNFHDLSIGHTFTISSNKVNALNLHFQDMVNAISAAPTHNFTYPTASGGTTTNPNINFSDGSQVGQNVNVPQQTLIRKYQFRDDFNWLHGKHNLKFGANEIYFAKFGGFFFFGANGYQAFFWDDPVCIQANSCPNGGSNYTSGISTPGAVQELAFASGSGTTAQPPWHSLGLYWQDSYKVTPRLTVNAGLRWDANIGFLRPMLGNTLTSSNRTIWWLNQTAMSAGSTLASDPGIQQIQQIVHSKSDLNRTTADWKEFQPRFGFAWDLSGNGKNVIRGGYGIARDQIFQNITLFSVQQTQPTIYQTLFDYVGTNAPGGGCAPTAPFNICSFRFGIDPFPVPPPGASAADITPGAVGRIVNPKITDPWSQQFSLGWQSQIGSGYAFSVDYYHTLGTHEERVLNANPTIRPVCDPAFAGSNPLDPRCVSGAGSRLMDLAFQTAGVALADPTLAAGRFAQIYEYSTNNRSMYDGINFQLRKRASRRIMLQINDTVSWSRSWGGFPVASYGGSGLAVTPQQQFASNEFARTNFDERNRFVFSGVFDVGGGFQVSPVFQASSGRPYSMLAGRPDVNGDGRHVLDRVCVGSTLANPLYPGDLNGTPEGCTMIKPNTLTGKAFIQMNLRASKSFVINERSKVWLYAEFFDLFNRSNFCNSYEEAVTDAQFNKPRAFCNGPSNAGVLSGFSAFAVPSLHTQLGLRFEF
jgi:hypothetical protein